MNPNVVFLSILGTVFAYGQTSSGKTYVRGNLGHHIRFQHCCQGRTKSCRLTGSCSLHSVFTIPTGVPFMEWSILILRHADYGNVAPMWSNLRFEVVHNNQERWVILFDWRWVMCLIDFLEWKRDATRNHTACSRRHLQIYPRETGSGVLASCLVFGDLQRVHSRFTLARSHWSSYSWGSTRKSQKWRNNPPIPVWKMREVVF